MICKQLQRDRVDDGRNQAIRVRHSYNHYAILRFDTGLPVREHIKSLAQIKHLVISVSAQWDIKHPRHSARVAALKHNFNHIVKSLNMIGNTLESLEIRFNSCFHGGVEEMRGDIDPLLTQPSARPVQIMRMDNTV